MGLEPTIGFATAQCSNHLSHSGLADVFDSSSSDWLYLPYKGVK